MIVYNNKRDPDKFGKKYTGKNFEQGIGISQKVVAGLQSGENDMNYLLCNNLVEYITPEEQENCYVCPFYDQLKKDKNNELKELEVSMVSLLVQIVINTSWSISSVT